MKYIGIDGCKGGWFCVGFEDRNRATWRMERISQLTDISGYLRRAELVLIDIPIGLRSIDPLERRCDVEARKVLQPYRGSSVFPTPCRNALKFDDYMQASAMNWSCTGRKLSRQVWNIMPRIREVDLYIRRRRLRGKIREMHPEVVFWALNGKVPLEHSKHTAEGIGARSRLLSPLFPGLPELIRSVGENGWFGRGLVAEDDVLDAVAGAVTATCKSALRTLPAIPEADRYGLPMEVVYPDVS